MNRASFLLVTLSLACCSKLLWAQNSLEEKEAVVPRNPLKDAFFGETHVHTSYSLDAYIGGNRITPDSAYRFAKGESVEVNGTKHNIVKPLDFAAVTDHAEYIAEMYSTQVMTAPGHDHEKLVELRGLKTFEEQEQWFLKEVVANARGDESKHTSFFPGELAYNSAWRLMVLAAESHYEPGKFSTLVAFEWSAAPNGGNMHRNVFFRDMVVPLRPFSAIDSNDEEDLWAWMKEQEKRGSKLFAVPHNSNASKGFMFEPIDNSGSPIDKTYAERRAHFEPLVEMMQIKGNSEVHRKFWPADEFADFENADSIGSYSGRTFKKSYFVRDAVISGLVHQTKIGVNPFKMGFVGGTDNHNGSPGDVVENNYVGSHGGADSSVERRFNKDIAGWIMGKDSNPGAITGVWATRNTRSAIWDAMYTRECFATSGTRLKPRFFGGDLPADPGNARTLVQKGYEHGVPMGGTLSELSAAPTFYAHVMKDPDGANLDRIQIIKGWVTADGIPGERIYDVAVSNGRKIDEDGRCRMPVGNTVHVSNATFDNSIGAAQLQAVWTDPDFDSNAYSFYYTRTLEIPTPRWSTYDAKRYGLSLPTDLPTTIQERAWTSPIWYSPSK